MPASRTFALTDYLSSDAPTHLPPDLRRSADLSHLNGVKIGSISQRTRHVMPIITYWHWGVGILPMMSHGGGPPEGDIEPPGGFEDALQAFKRAFTERRAGIPDDDWRENLEYMRAGQERWRK
jgi:hypothetical protein